MLAGVNDNTAPQSGRVVATYYDANGNIIPVTNPSPARVEWSVTDSRGNNVVIQKFP